jgi:cellulose synthase (UDP-forming)
MAFPSINGSSKSWAGKGRTWLEAHYYGPFLSSFSYNPLDGEYLMPNCTGSHYAVRTSALKKIGGIGPELDEDLSTTIMFMSRGFKGVYSIDTIALGLGPETFESAMVQEFQWARSAIILFFRWFKVMIPNFKYFTAGLWMRSFTTLYYYISQGLFVFWILAGSIITYYMDWCTDASKPCWFSLINFLLRTLPAVFIAYGHYLMVRRRGWLRAGTLEDPPPPILSTPVVWLYRALRVVWMSRGVIAGFQELLFHKTPQFKVTPKGQNDVAVLSVSNLLPLYTIYIIFGVSFWLPFIWKEPDQMGIALYMYICTAGTTCITIFVVFMHFWENGRANLGNALAHFVMVALLIAGLVVTSVLESRVIFNAAAGNLFIPVEVFSHEWIVMLVFYGISAVHILLSAFVY